MLEKFRGWFYINRGLPRQLTDRQTDQLRKNRPKTSGWIFPSDRLLIFSLTDGKPALPVGRIYSVNFFDFLSVRPKIGSKEKSDRRFFFVLHSQIESCRELIDKFGFTRIYSEYIWGQRNRSDSFGKNFVQKFGITRKIGRKAPAESTELIRNEFRNNSGLIYKILHWLKRNEFRMIRKQISHSHGTKRIQYLGIRLTRPASLLFRMSPKLASGMTFHSFFLSLLCSISASTHPYSCWPCSASTPLSTVRTYS